MLRKRIQELIGAYCLPRMTDEYLLTDSERSALLRRIKDRHDVLNKGIELMLYTGLALEEVVAVRRRDIDFDAGTLTISRLEVKVRSPRSRKYRYELVDLSDRYDLITIDLTDEAMDVLGEIIKMNARSEYLLMVKSKRVCSDTLLRRLSNDCKAVGISAKKPQAIQLAFAIGLLQDGYDVETALGRLGRPWEGGSDVMALTGQMWQPRADQAEDNLHAICMQESEDKLRYDF